MTMTIEPLRKTRKLSMSAIATGWVRDIHEPYVTSAILPSFENQKS